MGDTKFESPWEKGIVGILEDDVTGCYDSLQKLMHIHYRIAASELSPSEREAAVSEGAQLTLKIQDHGLRLQWLCNKLNLKTDATIIAELTEPSMAAVLQAEKRMRLLCLELVSDGKKSSVAKVIADHAGFDGRTQQHWQIIFRIFSAEEKLLADGDIASLAELIIAKLDLYLSASSLIRYAFAYLNSHLPEDAPLQMQFRGPCSVPYRLARAGQNPRLLEGAFRLLDAEGNALPDDHAETEELILGKIRDADSITNDVKRLLSQFESEAHDGIDTTAIATLREQWPNAPHIPHDAHIVRASDKDGFVTTVMPLCPDEIQERAVAAENDRIAAVQNILRRISSPETSVVKVTDRPLSTLQKRMLRELLANGAVDADHLINDETLATKLDIENYDSLKRPGLDLVRRGFVAARRGPDGGRWLTAKGVARASSIDDVR